MRKVKELYLLKTPNRLWQEISINIIRPLPKSNGQNIIVDQFTKIIKLKAIMIAILSEDIAKIYKNKI